MTSNIVNPEEFISKARSVHGDKYAYKKDSYTGCRSRITVTCPRHGDFIVESRVHLNGSGCKECERDRKFTDRFIPNSIKLHGGRYDYRKVDYVNTTTKVIITCPQHGDFLMKPSCHLSGRGCRECASRKASAKNFIEKSIGIHGDKYDYSRVIYVNNLSVVTIGCPIHGDFEQVARIHLMGCDCPTCAIDAMGLKRRSTTDGFIAQAKEVHGDRYDYSLVEYEISLTRIKIVCREHGVFMQLPSKHLEGYGCQECSGSSGEKMVASALRALDINFEMQKRFEGFKSKKHLKFDFYLPDRKTLIEYDGLQHYKSSTLFGGEEKFAALKKHDKMKDEFAANHGIKLIRIPYTVNTEAKIREIIKGEDY